MKKKILLLITILLLASACSSSYLKKINVKTLNQKLENKESFVLCLIEDDAGDTLRNTLMKVAKKNDIKTYYLNTNKLSDEDLEKVKKKFTFEEGNIIIFIKDGMEETVLSRIEDTYISEKNLEKELQNQGFIK